MPNCEECKDCNSSKSNDCNKANKHFLGMPRYGTMRFKSINGEEIHHFVSVSSFAEYTVVDICQLVKINPQIPVDKACLLSCGVTTGWVLYGRWRFFYCSGRKALQWRFFDSVQLVRGAKLQGASRIIGVDINPKKEELEKEFGVMDFINHKDCGDKKISEVIKELTEGGADYTFECIGLVSVMQDAFDSSREGWGKTVILGVDPKGTPLCINTLSMMTGKTVSGSLFGGIKAKSDIPVLAQRYMNKELCLDGFITHEVNLPEINEAFEHLIRGESLRCTIWMAK